MGEDGFLSYLNTPASVSFDGKQRSTGSGVVFNEYCWVAKYNTTGDYVWSKYCDDPSFINDKGLPIASRVNNIEQSEWSQKASKFFQLNPKDATGLLGKETNYHEYASRRVPHGL